VPENAGSVPLELGTGRNEQRSGIDEQELVQVLLQHWRRKLTPIVRKESISSVFYDFSVTTLLARAVRVTSRAP